MKHYLITIKVIHEEHEYYLKPLIVFEGDIADHKAILEAHFKDTVVYDKYGCEYTIPNNESYNHCYLRVEHIEEVHPEQARILEYWL